MSIVLDNGRVRVEIDEDHGRMVRAAHAGLGIEVVTEPRLAENFRLLLPLPSRHGHYLAGRDQRLTGVRAGAQACTLSWDGLHGQDRRFDIEVTQTIRLSGDDITFQADLVNHSPFEVEEVSSIVLGGLGNSAERSDWRIHFADETGQGQEWLCYERFPAATSARPGRCAPGCTRWS